MLKNTTFVGIGVNTNVNKITFYNNVNNQFDKVLAVSKAKALRTTSAGKQASFHDQQHNIVNNPVAAIG